MFCLVLIWSSVVRNLSESSVWTLEPLGAVGQSHVHYRTTAYFCGFIAPNTPGSANQLIFKPDMNHVCWQLGNLGTGQDGVFPRLEIETSERFTLSLHNLPPSLSVADVDSVAGWLQSRGETGLQEYKLISAHWQSWIRKTGGLQIHLVSGRYRSHGFPVDFPKMKIVAVMTPLDRNRQLEICSECLHLLCF